MNFYLTLKGELTNENWKIISANSNQTAQTVQSQWALTHQCDIPLVTDNLPMCHCWKQSLIIQEDKFTASWNHISSGVEKGNWQKKTGKSF